MKPNKLLGQHFLTNTRALDKIVATANLQTDDVVLEVGPGKGILTKELAKTAKKVIAIEKDQRMVEFLGQELKEYNNVEVIQSDALEFQTPKTPYKVVANIPYYITAPLIRKFLEASVQPTEMVLMIQKEVAQRICAKAPDMNLLAVSVQFYAEPKIISYVSKGSFWPAPKIDSAIIKITPKKTADIDPTLFFNIVKAGFLHPRKQLGNNLATSLKKDKQEIETWLNANKLNPKQRAETLTVKDWINLTKTFSK